MATDERHVVGFLTDVRSGANTLEVAVENGKVEIVMFHPPNLPTRARFTAEHATSLAHWLLDGAGSLRKTIDARHGKLIGGIKP